MSCKVAVVSTGAGNLSSVRFALERLSVEMVETSDPAVIESSTHIVLPGVGAAQKAMEHLDQAGLLDTLKSLHQPFLGICLGMQLLFDYSEEGDTPLLGIIPGRVTKFHPTDTLRVPHMGWSKLNFTSATWTTELHEATSNYGYYVHSYFAEPGQHTQATSTHGKTFAAIVQKDNYVGMQFHPERSSVFGSKLLKRFIEL